jgi:hypothetical protein
VTHAQFDDRIELGNCRIGGSSPAQFGTDLDSGVEVSSIDVCQSSLETLLEKGLCLQVGLGLHGTSLTNVTKSSQQRHHDGDGPE